MTSTQSFRESMVLEHLHNPNYIFRVAAVSVSVGDSREEESPSSCLPHNDYLWHGTLSEKCLTLLISFSMVIDDLEKPENKVKNYLYLSI